MDICGYAGNILYIGLTSGKVRTEKLDPELIKSFIGGYGISTKLAYDLIPPDVDPLSPENLIIIGTGPFAGTLAPGAAKISFTTKFPINNAFATAASGGNFAWMLKSNGYDFAVIGGQASYPVYLNITENGAEICDASHLWGKDIFETVDELRNIYQLSSIIPIGPAGENLVKISITSMDKGGTIGSGGLPAVMGSKKLKAIVVQQGNKAVRVAHPVRFMRLVNNLYERVQQWSGRERFLKHGNANIPETAKDRETIIEMHAQARELIACASCPLAEKERVRIEDDEGKSLVTYMTHFNARKFGADSAIEEFFKEAKYQDAINRYGLCHHQFLNAMDFMVDLYKSGVISKEDTDGIELNDDYDTVMNLMQLTAYRKGLGDILAEGALGAARRIGRGAEAHAVQIKGRSIVYDPRLGSLGTMEFEQITTPRGAHVAAGGSPSYDPGRTLKDFERHSERMGAPDEAVKRIVGETSFNPGRLSRYSEDWYSLFNCVSLCNRAWINRFYHVKTITELYSAITGIETTPAELMQSAERAWNMYKLLNVRAGFNRKDDEAPAAWFQPRQGEDADYAMTDYYKTKTLTKQDIESLLDDYYDERGWDIRTGIPTTQKLEELGLCDEAIHLKQD
ncbi:aldehyde ferredoxin oxidoreductase C-terminal domain-containing protein [Chloroflexota bacterium]